MTATISPVKSSVIDAIAYQDGDLFVWFLSGRVYVYYDVPQREFERFDQATSKGQFFSRNIRGRYAWREVTGMNDQRKEVA